MSYQGQNLQTWKGSEDALGGFSEEQLGNLFKALTVGQSINAPGSVVSGDGFSLRVESLDGTLRSVSFRQEHIKLWKMLPKVAAINTIEEYNQLQEYGQKFNNFYAEGALPDQRDSKYERKYVTLKFMGIQRGVSLVSTLVKGAHGPIIAQETVNGTKNLLESIEDSLFFGDSSLSSVQFDGYKKLIESSSPAANIIDLRGARLSEDYLEDGGLRMGDAPNYGRPTHLFLNPRAKSQLLKDFFPKGRYPLLDKPSNGNVGLDVASFTTSMGEVQFVSDVFMDLNLRQQSASSLLTAPAAPSFSVQPTAGAPVGVSQWAADDVGSYRYAIVSVGASGKSAAVQDSGAVAVVAGQSVQMTLASGSDTLYYEIYRTVKGGAAGSGYLIHRVARSGATQVFEDLNATLPKTSIAIMFQMDSEAVTFRQLGSMLRIPLGTIAASIRWMQWIHGAPVLHTPGKIIMFKNVSVD